MSHWKSRTRLAKRATSGHDASGFTLIELLIVIVVLGILSGIVVFSLSAITGQSAQAACNSDVKSVETAVAAYEAQNSGATPPATSTSGSPGWWTPYLKSWPSENTKYYGVSTAVDGSGNYAVWVTQGAAAPVEYNDASPSACNISS